MLTHDNIYSNVRAAERIFPAGPDDVALSFLPLSHVFQRMVDYFFFARGATIAYIASFDLVAQGMAEVRPTMVASNPRVYEKLYAAVLSVGGLKRRLVFWARAVGLRWTDSALAGRVPPLSVRIQHALADRLVYRKIRERIGGRLRFFISGSAPLAPEIARFFYAARILILEGYGLTETSPVTNVNTPAAFKFGTVGPPIPGTEIEIAPDGEILVRGRQVMKGYFNLPEATAEAIDAEGWFHTGDIGELDAEGFLKITDRKKDLIVTAGGKNIAPQPIENLAKMSRYVAEAVMLGDRRPYPVLLVVPNFTNLGRWARATGVGAAEPRELVRDARVQQKMEEEVFRRLEGLARYETPKKIALLFDEFSIERGELTPTLKVRRRVVEAHYRSVIDALYDHPEQVVAE
jgi:long-chain acyl-CoA synthetase